MIRPNKFINKEYELQVPVLTYHGVNVISNTYRGNDHIALADDLRAIHGLGFKIVPLKRIFDWHQGMLGDDEVRKTVAISLDDGSWFDFYDLDHPTCGPQRSMLNILRDFQKEVGPARQPGLHATSFVISSPDARRELDKKGLIGKGWWGDEWWLEALNTKLMGIECHSWDHNHPDLERVAQGGQRKGSFLVIDSYADCDMQVAKAGDYIQTKLNKVRPGFFAFPWGQASEYMLNRYLPEHQERHGFLAAFTTEPRPVRKSDRKWELPRFIFGRDWHSSTELEQILVDAQPRSR